MTAFDADRIINGLTGFQQASVRHVMEQFYGPANASRFLVADETGLGKSMVARGLIARTIAELQEHDDVKRIDIVYVCSNADLAKQNLTRLKVTDDLVTDFESRLTLLGKHSHTLNKQTKGTKAVNLVAFTPGTSFDMGHSTGKAEERAMLFLALAPLLEMSRGRRKAALRLLQGGVQLVETFDYRVALLDEAMPNGIDPVILTEFHRGIKKGVKGLLARFQDHQEQVRGKHSVPDHLAEPNRVLVGELRAELARASVETLEPDLIILDEFQRFRSLLSEDNPAGELAHHLFKYPGAKVLLLSATPYKPFTYAEEREDNHAKDLLATLGFLAQGRTDVTVDEIRDLLSTYREQVTTGSSPAETVGQLRTELLKVMSRAERPDMAGAGMRVERIRVADKVKSEDLVGYVNLQAVAREVATERDQSLVTVDYWKSAPYFINFCDGYKIGQRLRDAGGREELPTSLASTQHISAKKIRTFKALDGGNARMRDLLDSTVGQGWWKLLWVPPSMPYFEPSGPYADAALRSMTKQVVFSSWSATPTAVASVLSYEAERMTTLKSDKYTQYTPEGRKAVTQHLTYSVSSNRVNNMSTLLLSWPMLRFASLADPLPLLASREGVPLSQKDAVATVREAIRSEFQSTRASTPSSFAGSSEGEARESAWRLALSEISNWPGLVGASGDLSEVFARGPQCADASTSPDDAEDQTGLGAHLREASRVIGTSYDAPSDDMLTTLARVALYSLGNISLRTLRRLLPDDTEISPLELFRAASVLSNGLRSLFNKPDVSTLVEQLTTDAPFWQRVLEYASWGNLEAVLDEYLFHLREDQFSGELTAEKLLVLANTAAEATSLRTSTYRALNAANLREEKNLSFVPRIALRYGSRSQKAEDARQPEIRRSFNSPFWPLVLTSTSVGQEGIDFHWWCHSVFHWNTPANPVDFEQREGRVDRYLGHAVRRNIAERHGQTVLSTPDGHPWAHAVELAKDLRAEYGDFAPHWVYPGRAQIERHVAPFALSSDERRYEHIKDDVALYRLTFGQPRQEDMLELLKRHGIEDQPETLAAMRVDLSPPA